MAGTKSPHKGSNALLRISFGWVGLVFLAVVWQLAAIGINKTIFPSFTTSIIAALHLATSSILLSDILPSIERTILGFFISAVIGISAGVIIGHYEVARKWSGTVVDFLRSLPTPLLVPIAVVIFGLNGRMVIATIVTAAIWPILINTANGTSSIESTMLDTAKTYGLRGRSLFLRVVLPAASPQIFAGLRVALSVSLVVMVVAEMLGGGSGIGYYISNAQQSFNIKGSYGGVIILGAMGWMFDTLFLMLEGRILSWQRGTVGGMANA
ncbi:MAG: ABC transporter permease [Acidimicrobiaceae bacterium]|nr:ABC transporter permease [Acidimicrobiaceae bacterium]